MTAQSAGREGIAESASELSRGRDLLILEDDSVSQLVRRRQGSLILLDRGGDQPVPEQFLKRKKT